MTKVLVTGASGFIGRHLCAALRSDGRTVIELLRPGASADDQHPDRSPAQTLRCDIRDSADFAKVVEQCAPDTIVNLAVDRTANPEDVRAVGLEAVCVLLSVAAELGAHVVHAGSSAEIGTASLSAAIGIHGATKVAASERVAAAVTRGDLEAITLRPSLVYGPGEGQYRFVPTAINAALHDVRLPITAKSVARDYVYVGDVVDAFRQTVIRRLTRAQPVDLCTGVSTTNRDLVRVVEHVTGTAIDLDVGAFAEKPWDRPEWSGDSSDTAALLGREPIGLVEGIERSVQWWKSQ